MVTITVAKENTSEWWNMLATGEAELDLAKIEPEHAKLGELDGETRTMVEKMMFDTRAKTMGMPTSDEIQKQRTLERFMKQHPELDFSGAKIH